MTRKLLPLAARVGAALLVASVGLTACSSSGTGTPDAVIPDTVVAPPDVPLPEI